MSKSMRLVFASILLFVVAAIVGWWFTRPVDPISIVPFSEAMDVLD